MTVLYLVGAVVGVLVFVSLPYSLRHVLVKPIVATLPTLTTVLRHPGVSYANAFISALAIVAIWIMGQAMGGQVMTSIIVWLRACSVGFAMAAIAYVEGLRGAGFDLLGILPWNILSAGGFIIAASAVRILHQEMVTRDQPQVRSRSFFLYSMACAVGIWLTYAGGFIESVWEPRVVLWFALQATHSGGL